jgi:organic hydroperoxide reductase OsmC/OhrA
MSKHRAAIQWRRETANFAYADYNREHHWIFPGGSKVNASAAPEFLGKPENVDPEEAFVASISACHMLTFLAICTHRKLVVNSYKDEACGFLEKNDQGRLAITRVELSPQIQFNGSQPEKDVLKNIHRLSHEQCFIANSINTQVTVMGMA